MAGLTVDSLWKIKVSIWETAIGSLCLLLNVIELLTTIFKHLTLFDFRNNVILAFQNFLPESRLVLWTKILPKFSQFQILVEKVVLVCAEEKFFHLIGHFVLKLLKLYIDGFFEQMAEYLAKTYSRLVLNDLFGY